MIEFKTGIKILAKQFNSDGFFGLSAEDKYGAKIIVVNTWDRISIERKIFSIVHELGHILLHFNSKQEDLLIEDENEEKQANQFASFLLLPLPSPKSFPSAYTSAVKLFAWSGPSSLLMR